jgi:hypothetical protein
MIVHAHTSHNRIVYASPPKGGSGYEKTQSGFALCGFFLRHIFGVAGTASQFLYRNPKNVVYNIYVMRNATLNFLENYVKRLRR